jgi:GAF domain-containing protein
VAGSPVVSDSDAAARFAELIAARRDAASLPHRICLACVETLPVTAASISVVIGNGSLTPLCTSNALAASIEELQFTVGIGPCVDAATSGQPVLVPDLADTTDPVVARWPTFAGPAVHAGIRAVYAFPLRIGAITLGVIDLCRDTPAVLTEPENRHAQLVANTAALAVLAAAAPVDHDAFHLAEVYQAAGMMMIQLQVAIDVALLHLRAYCFARNRPIGDVAKDVVARRLHFDPYT